MTAPRIRHDTHNRIAHIKHAAVDNPRIHSKERAVIGKVHVEKRRYI
jgi:hypothetical protein